MKEIISQQTATMLNSLQGKLLLNGDNLICIDSVKTQKDVYTPEKTFFNKHPKDRFVIYLTELKIRGYNDRGRFMGLLDDSASLYMVRLFDFYNMRNKWEAMHEQIKAFGYTITANPK